MRDGRCEIFGNCFNKLLTSSQPTLDLMYFFSKALGFKVVEYGMVLIKANSILLSLSTKKSGCSKFKKNTLVKICLHTNLRNRNYDLFELLLLNSWFFFLPVCIFCIFS